MTKTFAAAKTFALALAGFAAFASISVTDAEAGPCTAGLPSWADKAFAGRRGPTPAHDCGSGHRSSSSFGSHGGSSVGSYGSSSSQAGSYQRQMAMKKMQEAKAARQAQAHAQARAKAQAVAEAQAEARAEAKLAQKQAAAKIAAKQDQPQVAAADAPKVSTGTSTPSSVVLNSRVASSETACHSFVPSLGLTVEVPCK